MPATASTGVTGATLVPVTLDVALTGDGPATWQVRADLYLPAAGTPRTVQLLVSGLTYDRRYWQAPGVNNYVQHMVDAGYAVFALDRIGTGESDRPPATEVTVASNVTVLDQVTRALREGVAGYAFDRVVAVGHSLGSGLAIVQSARHGGLDAIVATGLLHATGSRYDEVLPLLRPAATDPALEAAAPPDGYLTTAPGGRATLHENATAVTDELSRYNEATKSTVTMGEGLTLAEIYDPEASRALTVPVLVVVGEKDEIFGGGEVATTGEGPVREFESRFYPPEAELEVHVLPGAAHALNVHTNADEWYSAARRWIDRRVVVSHDTSRFGMARREFVGRLPVSTAAAGLLAVLVAYTGPLAVVFQAARAAHLDDAHLSSWIWAVSVGSGLTGAVLSLVLRIPVVAAWSTAGAALLVSAGAAHSLPEAVGAYLVAAALTVAVGATGAFGAVMRRVPRDIVGAMLAGVLVPFGLDAVGALGTAPRVAAPMLAAYLVARRLTPRYAVVVPVALGFALAGLTGSLATGHLHVALSRPVLVVPHLAVGAVVGLGVPLFLVTMASQNAPGVAVLSAAGYESRPDLLVTSTGVASAVFAPFGSHALNLAAITAAICTGPEAHEDPGRRYLAGVWCGAFYVAVGSFGATLAALFAALPHGLVAATAGVALFGPTVGALATATGGEHRDSAAVTFLVTASGVTLAGIGSAFWGLLLGAAAHLLFAAGVPLPRRGRHRDAGVTGAATATAGE